jgi:hypothetical protein
VDLEEQFCGQYEGRHVWRTERGGGVQITPHPRNSEDPPTSCQTQTRLWKMLKIAEFRTLALQDVRKKGSKILKLPPVRNCFTLAMTDKLAVIINSLILPKIKKILLYEMKFLVPNYSCLQNPCLGGGVPPPDWGGYRPPQIPVSVLNWICCTPPNKIAGYATDTICISKGWMKVNKTVLCHAYKLQTQIFSVIFQAACGVFSFHKHDCILDNVKCIRL